MELNFQTPLSLIPTVGEKRKNYFQKLGIENIEDILFFFPRRYHDLRNFKQISNLIPGEIASVKGKVLVREEKKFFHRVSYLKVAITDDTGILYLTFFNQLYLKDVFLPSREFFINGKVEIFKNELHMINPIYEIKKGGRKDWILPIYPLTKGLTQKYIRKVIKNILNNFNNYSEMELLSFDRRQKLGLSNIKYALSNIHFPRSDIDLEKARNYLIFHEFFKLQLSLLFKKTKIQDKQLNQEEFFREENLIEEFEKLLPFKLTFGQKEVIEEIIEDLKNGKIIQRLIQGEVGSGKTVVAIFVLWVFAIRGFQGVLLTPTEILAEQHFLNWQEFFLKQNISVSILLGELPKSEKTKIMENIKNGEIKVVIGTHALLSENISFKNLKVLIVDEQHKFGVKQRELLRQKGEEVHYIVMSATPIPRSIALTFYGNLDFSSIGDLPKGERKVVTYLFSKEEKEKIYHFLKHQLSLKKQGFLITPAIEGKEDIKSAIKEYELVKEKFPEFPISIIHGKLSRVEKEKVMDKFRKKEVLLLVSTSVVESGIDVPEASFIIIEQAERFGLAQLHQLRGRVGRKGEIGYCFLISYTNQGDIIKRLETFLETEKGLEIAEIDLKLRGPGDLLGTRQHGILPLKIGNIVSDLKMLNLARKEAERIFEEDPELQKYENQKIKNFLLKTQVS